MPGRDWGEGARQWPWLDNPGPQRGQPPTLNKCSTLEWTWMAPLGTTSCPQPPSPNPLTQNPLRELPQHPIPSKTEPQTGTEASCQHWDLRPALVPAGQREARRRSGAAGSLPKLPLGLFFWPGCVLRAHDAGPVLNCLPVNSPQVSVCTRRHLCVCLLSPQTRPA